MKILHCVRNSEWEFFSNLEEYKPSSLSKHGFIHCSDIHIFHLVAPNFSHISKDELSILLINTNKINSKIVWEDLDNMGIPFPHIYGPLPINSVEERLPFLRDDFNTFVLNNELRTTI